MIISLSQCHPSIFLFVGGLVGLVLAQGLKKHDVPYTVYERESEAHAREQGWSITIHWSLPVLQQILPESIFAKLDSVAVDPLLEKDAGNFLVLDARNLDIICKIPPNERRVRANRGKLRDLLLQDLNVEFGKDLSSYDTSFGYVMASFTDGTTAKGTLLVGCDGSKSTVRRSLVGAESSMLNQLPVQMKGVTQRMSQARVAPLRALDPLLFLAINPETGIFLWHSIQNIIVEKEGEEPVYEVQTMISQLIKGPEDVLPEEASNLDRMKDMKKKVAGFTEPLLSTVIDIPEDTKVVSLSIGDWIPQGWDGQGLITLAGDAAGAMTMYRGEGANHGFLDAACLASLLVDVRKGRKTQVEALLNYETELRERREIAIPLSRAAALDAHNGIPARNSPLVSGRFAPATSARIFFE
ncbi:FAD/NAD(P)-binding domain-containing protein [Ramaria rubella]|nr:FAD/NAD(P)-binding domain-containing protein [Ramaria rubella]